MKHTKSMFKTNVIYGLVVLVPVGIIVLLLAKLVEFLKTVAEPIGEALGLRSAASIAIAMVLAVLLLLLFCYLVGSFVRTQIGSWSFERLENTVLTRLPGYQIIGNVLKGFAESRTAYPAAMVRLAEPGTAVFGFVMEENENGHLTVFVPSSPTLTVGTVHFVSRERVSILDASAMDVTNCLSQWGIGSSKIVRDVPS